MIRRPSILVNSCAATTTAKLLRAVAEGELRLSFTGRDGMTIDFGIADGGEMAGSYFGSDVWRAQYST